MRHLKEGKPISIKLARSAARPSSWRLLYGKTLADCARQLQEVGLNVPLHAIKSPGKAH